jgi:hypothetical protein
MAQENLLFAWGLLCAYQLSTYYLVAPNTILIETDAENVLVNLKRLPMDFVIRQQCRLSYPALNGQKLSDT